MTGQRLGRGPPTYRGRPLDEVMAQPRRQAILALVREEPGIGPHQLSERLGVSVSAIMWHTDVMQTLGVLVDQRDGPRHRFYAGAYA